MHSAAALQATPYALRVWNLIARSVGHITVFNVNLVIYIMRTITIHMCAGHI